MFGWEFPPLNTGGLGTACYGLTKGLSKNAIEITLVLPHTTSQIKAKFLKKIIGTDVKIKRINSPIIAYVTPNDYEHLLKKRNNPGLYGKNLFAEVQRYAKEAKIIASQEKFDVIHAHDWLTYKAGIEAKKVTKKPLVVHVHATEFDRTGGNNVNQAVYNIEREGMCCADKIIAVSNYTKNLIIKHYGISAEKIEVVHNAINPKQASHFTKNSNQKTVLFLGRLTLQKGPDYFLYAAKKALEIDPNIRFLVVGSGDMESFLIEKAVELGIADKVLFAGFLRGEEVDKAYQIADLFVMPSVSEPFGLTALESMKNDTPILISKTAGVSEVITNCLKVDFWDINQMVNKMLNILKYKVLHDCLEENAKLEVQKFSWNTAAKKCIQIYHNMIGGNAS